MIVFTSQELLNYMLVSIPPSPPAVCGMAAIDPTLQASRWVHPPIPYFHADASPLPRCPPPLVALPLPGTIGFEGDTTSLRVRHLPKSQPLCKSSGGVFF